MFRSKPNHAQSSSSSSSSQCRKHPKHKQSPGVCSLCLTQKLVKISPEASTRDAPCRRLYSEEASSCESSRMSYSSSSDESSDVSSCVSPGRDVGLVTGIVKFKDKCRFWSRLALITRRKKTTRAYFQGQLLLSHSEPLPTITSAT